MRAATDRKLVVRVTVGVLWFVDLTENKKTELKIKAPWAFVSCCFCEKTRQVFLIRRKASRPKHLQIP